MAAFFDLGNGQGPQGDKASSMNEEPFSWEKHVLKLSESQFKLRYRVSSLSFYKLLALVEHELVSNEKFSRLSKGYAIETATKLAVALRFLAGGQMLDLSVIYKLSIAMCYHCVWLVVDAVNTTLPMEFPIDDVQKLQALSDGFQAKSANHVWSGQVGAVDGVHFAMRKPNNRECSNAGRYFVQRKDEHALLCTAICDANRRFLYYDISKASTTHDSLAFSSCSLGRKVLQGQLPWPFFLNGDNAYVPSNSMLTPSNNPDLDAYDFHQSSNRMAIECAFGILVRRWGVLWRPLHVSFSRRAPLIGALMRLHNFCIDERLEMQMLLEKDGRSLIQPERWAKTPTFDGDGRPTRHLDTEDAETRPTDFRTWVRTSRTDRRDLMVQAIVSAGLVRPPLSQGLVPKQRGRRSN